MGSQYQKVMSKLLLGPEDGTEITGTIRRDDFDEDFVFGSASSAYQYEGAAQKGGKGPNIWDSWTHNHPDRIADGSNGDVAVNQYHLYKEDVNLMKRTGFDGCRFSISWARILPGGRLNGGINKEGIKYYNDLIDTILVKGMKPYVTIFHFDLPLALELEYGGFLSDKIIKDYCEYAELCFWEFGDRVKNWITFNEGWTYCNTGYVQGTWPPGHGCTSQQNSRYHPCSHKGSGIPRDCPNGDPGKEPYLAAHNMLLAHAYAVDLYRKHFQEHQGGKIGITNISHFFEPLNECDEDREASMRALDWMFGWFTAPIATGDYPPSMRKTVGDRLPRFSSEEQKLVKGSYDFLGVNYYTTSYAVNTPRQPGDQITYLSDQELNTQFTRDGVSLGEASGTNWVRNVPRGLYNTLVYAKEIYNISLIYITENGVDEHNETKKSLSEARQDPNRIKYHNDHLWYLRRAIREAGVSVKAYFLWSFSDNFEWADGFTTRFGIFYIDYNNGRLTRYPKSSAVWWMNFLSKKSIKGPTKEETLETECDEPKTVLFLKSP